MNRPVSVHLSPRAETLLVRFSYDKELVELMGQVPGRQFQKELGAWTVPANKSIARVLYKVMGGLAAWDQEAIDYLKAIPDPILPDQVAIDPSLQCLKKFWDNAPEMYEFQKVGASALALKKNMINADNVGLGKSGQALTASQILDAETVLVICPKFLMNNWYEEIKKWTGRRALLIESGSDEIEFTAKEMSAAAKTAKYCVINYEAVAKAKGVMNRKWDCLIADECHLLRGWKSLRSKAARKIKSDSKFLLSATPLVNRTAELWPLLDMVAGGEFGDYYTFCKRYAGNATKRIPAGVACPSCGVRKPHIKGTCEHCGSTADSIKKWRDIPDFSGSSNLEELHERIAPYIISRKQSDVLKSMPPFTRVDKIVSLDAAGQEAYDAIIESLIEYLVQYKDLTPEQAMKSAFHEAMRRAGEFRQLLSKLKIAAAVEDIRQAVAGGNSAVVFVCYVDTAKEVVKALSAGGDDWDPVPAYIHTGEETKDEKTFSIAKFKQTQGNVLVCTIQCSGIGLNLTEASYAFFIDCPWTPTELFQGEGRLKRIGQNRDMFFFRYFASGTYDFKIKNKLKEKHNIFDVVIGADESERIEADVSGSEPGIPEAFFLEMFARAKERGEAKRS